MIYRLFKRIFDFTSTLLPFVVISPLFLVLYLLVCIKLDGPIFFKQVRIGMRDKIFYTRRFRTMTNETNAAGELLPNDQRLVRFGKWLRSSSLDELPELLNIIRDDMVMIGSRSLYPWYNDYYADFEKCRFKVRSGLIPLESTYFDNYVTWDKQLKYEADCANELSLALDAKISMSVFKLVFLRTKTDYGSYIREALDKERSKSRRARFQ